MTARAKRSAEADAAAKSLIAARLQQLAARGEDVTYSEVGSWVALDMAKRGQRARLARLLTETSREEHMAGRPLLSAVVIGKTNIGVPGAGFVKLAHELGICGDRTAVECFAAERRRVVDYWSEQTSGSEHADGGH